MAPVRKGNLNDESASNSHNGWIVGHFMDRNSIFHSDEVEVKWGIHPKGFRKSNDADTAAKSISILISGKYWVKFSDNTEVVLERAGDYIVYENRPHTGGALLDTTIITIRWPSLSPVRK